MNKCKGVIWLRVTKRKLLSLDRFLLTFDVLNVKGNNQKGKRIHKFERYCKIYKFCRCCLLDKNKFQLKKRNTYKDT